MLLGLGIVEQSVFADIVQFIELKETLNNDEKDYNFFDFKTIEFAQNLHFVADKALLNFPLEPTSADSLLFQIKQRRKEKLVRSCLILAITDIYDRLQIESPF